MRGIIRRGHINAVWLNAAQSHADGFWPVDVPKLCCRIDGIIWNLACLPTCTGPRRSIGAVGKIERVDPASITVGCTIHTTCHRSSATERRWRSQLCEPRPISLSIGSFRIVANCVKLYDTSVRPVGDIKTA